MQIGIVGAGLTGLTAAYRLSQKRHKVVLFEKESQAGGLAAGFKEKDWQWSSEYFFHHLFVSDQAAKNLIAELGLSQKLFFSHPKTSIFKNGKISQFDSPFSLISFPHLSIPEKMRIGIAILYLKSTSNWQRFEGITASSWLRKYFGNNPYQILWKPLLEAKFGKHAPNISMAWFWARIKKRSQKLGYLKGGFQSLIDKLVEKIKKNGGKIYFNYEACCFNNLNHNNKFERIIFTTPVSVFLKVASTLPKEYKERLQKLKMLGALSLVFSLKEKFLTDNTYWLNINESGFPFVAVVEHTNFVDPRYYNGNHLVYVGSYYPQDHCYFKMKKEEIFKEFLPYLRKINPDFDFSLFTNHYSLFTSLFAQPIVPINYSQIIPKMKTPIPKVYLANMQMVYPWDRGINYAIKLGEKIAYEISKG